MSFTYNAVTDVVNTGQFNLFAGSDAIVLGKYSGSVITSDVAATTRTGSRNFKKSFNVVSKPENSFIPRLWAYTRIKNMMDRIDVEGETDTLVSAITNISLEFKFVTPYTSLFVEVPRNITNTTVNAIDAKPETITAAATATVAAIYANPVTTSPPSAKPPPTETPKEPGFGIIFAIIGLFAVKYLLMRKQK